MKQTKETTIQRGLEIIASANSQLPKYYKIDGEYIKFWISDNPYYIYKIYFKETKEQINHIKEDFIEKLKQNNFISYREEIEEKIA